MPWQLTYQAQVNYVPAGTGQQFALGVNPLQDRAGGAQTFKIFSTNPGQIAVGGGTGGILNGTDVTNLTNAVAVDLAAQMNANLTTINGYATGSP